ncbi:BadF/BadG/BcrA/BcrD ATPase family protein [Lacrimispora saccharolytica]|uniref:ATPase BadF/BadG/BcrA/BcrD type n=1 Tax=Lacrimispora saccharolytica (strain ATCC 35040 / DSM 2544 / NRCC 2533 / WM1) TaxID=610130 RepID=D9R758_LACSW|nr:BadF/BadG/BcrA/BcrD ATPase family protein [Lacrimispora saccharolytica]ADL05490.1 ATPase BadF/BadG/BcrA/BcrD type [[Clostridium] saccharolyticum WM1]QRV20347.1 ATPase [Lacrimispora saccharolytica]
MEGYIAGLDIGGTTGRMKLQSLEGESLGEVYGQGCSINTDGDGKSEERYRKLVLPALEERHLRPQDCGGICIAASGIDSPELEKSCRRAFINMGFRENAVMVQNDCEIFLNLSEAPTLVLVSGTGSISYGKDEAGRVVRTGGWGHILSDEGSAFHIGLNVMKHAGGHMDGREECPVLSRGFCGQTGIRDLSGLDGFINANIMDKAVIGALAPLASCSFEAGESAGISIIKESAEVLADLVKDTCRKMNIRQDQAAHLWLWGSVLVKNDHIRERLIHSVRESYIHMDIKIPEKRALDVAVEVAVRCAEKV